MELLREAGRLILLALLLVTASVLAVIVLAIFLGWGAEDVHQ